MTILVSSVDAGSDEVEMMYLGLCCERGIQRDDTNDHEGIEVINR